jgi:hypothetical protein
LTLAQHFYLSLGVSLVIASLLIAWLIRVAGMPTWAKIAAMVIAVIASCWAPYSISRMFGYPVLTTFADLPDCFALIAYRGAESSVNLWIVGDEGTPVAVTLALDEVLAKSLMQISDKMQPGGVVKLCKHNSGAEGENGDGEDGSAASGRGKPGGSKGGHAGALEFDSRNDLPPKVDTN